MTTPTTPVDHAEALKLAEFLEDMAAQGRMSKAYAPLVRALVAENKAKQAEIARLQQDIELMGRELSKADAEIEALKAAQPCPPELEAQINAVLGLPPQYLANLRHAYKQLVSGVVKDQKAFADGLIAPAIRAIEAEKPRTALERDAARYRLLRLRVYIDPDELILRIRDTFLTNDATVPEMLDYALDEALPPAPENQA